MQRQIVLDTETTGLDHSQGHRVIEIGCVELVNRRHTGRHFHHYLQPDREIDAEAMEVHGITNEFLADKPRFDQLAGDFLAFVDGAELIIHNAAFDIGFLDAELGRLKIAPPMAGRCRVLDSLTLARQMHPGQRNTLDALCKRYGIDNAQRTLHGALLDAEILADVYLAMTREQVTLSLEADKGEERQVEEVVETVSRVSRDRPPLRVIRADGEECQAHDHYLALLDKSAGGPCRWRSLEAETGMPGP